MTIALLNLEVRHERRIRATFTGSLAMGAFGSPAPAFYAVTSLDDRGSSPMVTAALIVPGNPNTVELALGSSLVAGALYLLTAEGVPGYDTTVTATPTEVQFIYGRREPLVNVETSQSDRERILYGIDLVWNETDFQETASGDLDRTSGTPNVTKALYRAVEANGLPWDDSYGGKAREFIDSPSTVSGTLLGTVSAQLLKDPRVKSIASSVDVQDESTFVNITPTLVSGEPVEPVSLTVPNGG